MLEHQTPNSLQARTPHLTDDEIRVLTELAGGSTADRAARRLDISDRTLRRRVRGVCDRLSVDTPIEAIVWAVKRGLI